MENTESYLTLNLKEINSNPNFKREVEHDAREGTYEDCLYHIKDGHESFLRYLDGCHLHYTEHGVLIENRLLNTGNSNLIIISFYNNQGKLVFEMNNFSKQNNTQQSLISLQPAYKFNVKVIDDEIVVEKYSVDGSPCITLLFNISSLAKTQILGDNTNQLAFDI